MRQVLQKIVQGFLRVTGPHPNPENNIVNDDKWPKGREMSCLPAPLTGA